MQPNKGSTKGLLKEAFVASVLMIIFVAAAIGVALYKGIAYFWGSRMHEEMDYASGQILSIDDYVCENGLFYMFLNNKGDVTACSETPPCSHLGASLPYSLLTAQGAESHFEISKLSALGDSYYYVCSVYAGDDKWLAMFMPADNYIAIVNAFLPTYFIAAAVISLLATAALWLDFKRRNDSLDSLRRTAAAYGKGEYASSGISYASPELSDIAGSLDNMAIKLQNADEARDDFIANVSHELRTPMTSISGYVNGIIDGTIPEEMQQHYLKVIRDETDRLSRLIGSMITVSGLDMANTELTCSDFDITRLISECLDSFSGRIEHKRIRAVVTTKNAYIVRADIDLIKQTLYNLLDNAVKFTDDGGMIKIFIEKKNGRVITSIRNSGTGINENMLPMLFDKFYKADKSRGIDKAGLGLGLSIASSIINRHGGTITVKSSKDEYTEFAFDLEAVK